MKYPALDNLTSPKEIKKMSLKAMKNLCEDIRNRITEVVRETGGHLGPNLGAVEIITACHHVFDLEKDRLVFDVGHQAYPHKLISGRHASFDKLRQKNGISGYPYQKESLYDVFRGGHASTAISTSVGISEGFKKIKEKSKQRVIALVGDGSLTGGMAFEGLNHAGHLHSNLIVILNDNTMSISPTVGAMSNYLNKIRHNKLIGSVKDEFIRLLKNLPRIGSKFEDIAKLIIEEGRTIINPGQIFTILGFDYYGPLAGHDLKEIIATLKSAKNQKGPVLIHALTDKGKGYKPEGQTGVPIQGPHALSPGTRKNEEAKRLNKLLPPKSKTYSAVFVEYLIELAKKNEKIVGITAAMSEGTALNKFEKKFKGRYYDVGICEQHATGFSAGLAKAGVRPVFAVYSTFLQRGFDQVFHDIALQADLPVLFSIDRAGLVGDDGPSHHGAYDIAYLRPMPGFVLMAPKDSRELYQMMRFALQGKVPSAIRYPRAAIPSENFFAKHEPIRLGKPEIVYTGEKICLLAYGAMVEAAAHAWQKLKSQGIRVTLVNARFAKPLDKKAYLHLARTHQTLITIEEGTKLGGYGSAVLECLHEDAKCGIHLMGIPDRLIEHASRNEQLKECKLDSDSIVKTVKRFLKI